MVAPGTPHKSVDEILQCFDTVAELRRYQDGAFVTGYQASVSSTSPFLWVLDRASTAADNGTTVVTTFSGMGRWLRWDTTARLLQSLTGATFQFELDNGNSGTGTITIDWTMAPKQVLTLTGSCTLAFTPPAGPCNLMLRLKQGGSGGYSITWPVTARGSGGTIQVGTTVDQYTLLGIYFDGTKYWVTSSANFPDAQATTALV